MPTYDYRCNSCANEFEVFQRITAEAAANCPKCSQPARRLVSAGTSLVFKGSGFYITDYKRKGAEGAEGGKDSASEKSDSSLGKSESASQKSESAAPSSEASGKPSAPSPTPAAPGTTPPAK